jgi:hypothetical protein
MTALTSLSKDWKALSIELLNDLFMSMPFEKRIPMLYKYFEEQDVMVTSSFGTKSIFFTTPVTPFSAHTKGAFH